MHHLLKHINQEDKDSTVNKAECRSKRNPTGKPRWAPTNSQSISILTRATFVPRASSYHDRLTFRSSGLGEQTVSADTYETSLANSADKTRSRTN